MLPLESSLRRPSLQLLMLPLLLLLCSGVSAQEPSLLIEDGAYGATVKGGLAAGESRVFYLSAEEGQKLTASLVSVEDSGYLVLIDADGKALLEDLPDPAIVRNLDLILPRSGKYILEVAAGKGGCSYVLEVTLGDPPGQAPGEPANL